MGFQEEMTSSNFPRLLRRVAFGQAVEERELCLVRFLGGGDDGEEAET
jgi:hypothetical protein